MKIYVLWYFRDKLTDDDRGYPIDFTVTAANPKQARLLAHRHRSVSADQYKNEVWLKKWLTNVKVIGTSNYAAPRIHSIGLLSE